MSKEQTSDFRTGLKPFVPEGSIDGLMKIIDKYPCQLTLTQARKTKLGDFRASPNGIHRISVNADLNPYAFLITITHEYAHLVTFEKYGRNVKPHGVEWKTEFRNLLLPFFSLNIFPKDIESALANYLRNPKAASGSDLDLQRALMNHNKEQDENLLEDLKTDDVFVFRNRTFKKGEKLRKRIKCMEISSEKNYLFNPLTPVEIFEDQTA